MPYKFGDAHRQVHIQRRTARTSHWTDRKQSTRHEHNSDIPSKFDPEWSCRNTHLQTRPRKRAWSRSDAFRRPPTVSSWRPATTLAFEKTLLKRPRRRGPSRSVRQSPSSCTPVWQFRDDFLSYNIHCLLIYSQLPNIKLAIKVVDKCIRTIIRTRHNKSLGA